MHNTEWTKPIGKGYIPYDSSIWHSGKSKMMETVKRSLVAWAGGGRDEEVELRGFLGHWNCLVWFYSDRRVSLHMCLNPQNVQHPEWALMYTMDLGWWWHVHVGSTVTNVIILVGSINSGEGYARVGQGCVGDICTFLSVLLWIWNCCKKLKS